MQCRTPRLDSWVGKIRWRRDRLPTPGFLGFSGGSVGKESACKSGDLDSILGLGRSPGEREWPKTWVQSLGWENILEEELPTPAFWLGEFHGLYSPWGHKELDITESLSLTLFLRVTDKHSIFVNNFCSVNVN